MTGGLLGGGGGGGGGAGGVQALVIIRAMVTKTVIKPTRFERDKMLKGSLNWSPYLFLLPFGLWSQFG
jgi:hypothetical protein